MSLMNISLPFGCAHIKYINIYYIEIIWLILLFYI